MLKNKTRRDIVTLLIVSAIFITLSTSIYALNQSNSTRTIINVTCGDNLCQIGENEYNCPNDCSRLPFDFETDFTSPYLSPGESGSFFIEVRSLTSTTELISMKISGDIQDYIAEPEVEERILPGESLRKTINIVIGQGVLKKVITGVIRIKMLNQIKDIPVTLRVIQAEDNSPQMTITVIEKKLFINDTFANIVLFKKVIYAGETSLDITYNLKDLKNNSYNILNETLKVNGYLHDVSIILNSLSRRYVLEARYSFDDNDFVASDTLSIIKPFWNRNRIMILQIILISIFLLTLAFVVIRIYRRIQAKRRRYIFPKFSTIPQKSEKNFWLGNIAESKKKSWLDPDDLTTHVLTAGSTGAGKSVSASIIVEEALMHKIPVVVFDPTSQWTGFLKPCHDQNLLKYYSNFGLDKNNDPRSFRGQLYDVKDPKVNIDFKKYMNPGEITVFNLSHLKTGEYDVAVKGIIDIMFNIQWEESPDLKMIVVFDEVHRLLEKYGGHGGYVALEKACREFRKWGIGLIMASQVNADFKEAVQGNILTEIQLNTKSMEDIKKIKQKYGKEFSERVTRQGIGVAMMQNAKYNNGKPWFVQFRPTLHSPHKIPGEQLKQYAKYSALLDHYEAMILNEKAKGRDIGDITLELTLTKNKLKEGNIKMVEIYLTSLKDAVRKLIQK